VAKTACAMRHPTCHKGVEQKPVEKIIPHPFVHILSSYSYLRNHVKHILKKNQTKSFLKTKLPRPIPELPKFNVKTTKMIS